MNRPDYPALQLPRAALEPHDRRQRIKVGRWVEKPPSLLSPDDATKHMTSAQAAPAPERHQGRKPEPCAQGCGLNASIRNIYMLAFSKNARYIASIPTRAMLAMTTDKKPKRAAGGRQVAKNMTEEQRTDRAKKAALARWGLRATHKGNFQQHLGLDIECYVLNDNKKTAVISQAGMAKALGLIERGNVLERFISSQVMSDYVVAELAEKLKNPLIFQWETGVAEVPPATVKGFDAALLIDLCNAILKANADRKLGSRYERIVQQAAIINGATAKAGITGVVYALAGYRPEIEEVIQAFKMFVQEEARKYEQEFPSELYLAWHRLYQIPIPARGKPWQLMHLTRRHIYYPLAKSSGRILELLRALRDRDPQKKKLFQFLNEVGTRAMRMHMGRVLEMAESSESSSEYERKFNKRFGDQQELDLVQRD